jgi:hypothetical protein
MKRILISCVALAAFAAPALADGAYYDLKASGAPGQADKNPVAFNSSDATGNGAVVGGNGTYAGGTYDWTSAPGTRAADIQLQLSTVGKGSLKQ